MWITSSCWWWTLVPASRKNNHSAYFNSGKVQPSITFHEKFIIFKSHRYWRCRPLDNTVDIRRIFRFPYKKKNPWILNQTDSDVDFTLLIVFLPGFEQLKPKKFKDTLSHFWALFCWTYTCYFQIKRSTNGENIVLRFDFVEQGLRSWTKRSGHMFVVRNAHVWQ